jgi:DnaJ domain
LTISGAYEVLCVDPTTVTPDYVHAAFHRLVLANHPDTFLDPELKRKANKKMIELNEAYATIRAAGFPRLVHATEPPRAAHAAQSVYHARSARVADDVDAAAAPWGARWQPHPEEWEPWHPPPDALDRMFERWMRKLGVAGLIAKLLFRVVNSFVETVVIPIFTGIVILVAVAVYLILRSILFHYIAQWIAR